MRTAAILLLPLMFLVVMAVSTHGFGVGGGYYTMGLIIGPSAFLGILSLYLPKAHSYKCVTCGWEKEILIKGSWLKP